MPYGARAADREAISSDLGRVRSFHCWIVLGSNTISRGPEPTASAAIIMRFEFVLITNPVACYLWLASRRSCRILSQLMALSP